MLAYSLVSVEHQKSDDLLTVLLGFVVLWALASTISFILAYRPSRIRNVRQPEAVNFDLGYTAPAAQPTLLLAAEDARVSPVVRVVPFDWAAARAAQERFRAEFERDEVEEAFMTTAWGENGTVN